MSRFQVQPDKIQWILDKIQQLESLLRAAITGEGLIRTTGDGGEDVGVLRTHEHMGTGEGGKLQQLNYFNGFILETTDISVSSDGATVTFSLQKEGGGDLTIVFSDDFLAFDTTPAATIALTPGSDTSPQINFVYILQSTGALTVSTSNWPSAEHAPLAIVILQSAGTTQTENALVVHVWHEHTQDSDEQGHASHIGRWLRNQHATWDPDDGGVAQTLTITVNAGVPDEVDFATTAGVVYQLHRHTVPAFDTSTGTNVHVVNDSVSPYTPVTDLADLLTDSAGGSMSGKYFNLVLWASVSQDTAETHLFVNLPSGSYNKQGDAIADVSGLTDFNIPSNFRGTGFLISLLTLRHQAASGGTWTSIQEIDLRGTFPNTVAGGGTSAITTEFADNAFKLFDDGDATKLLAFQCSGIATATTRTLTVPDASGTLVLSESAESITGLWNFIASGLGGLGDYDLTVGDVATPDYGIIQIGDSLIGRTSYNVASLDLDGAVIIRNMGGPVTGQIEFVITESGGDAIRFALAKAGVGNATYNPRSMLIAGPAVLDDDIVTVSYWQTVAGIFHNLVCDTGGDGADLGVQNDLEVEGDIFTDSIKESTPAAGVTIDSVLLKDGLVDGIDVANHGISAHTGHANWKVLYTDGSGDEQELALPADGLALVGAGVAAAPVFEEIFTTHIAEFPALGEDLATGVMGGRPGKNTGESGEHGTFTAIRAVAAAGTAGTGTNTILIEADDNPAFSSATTLFTLPLNTSTEVQDATLDNAWASGDIWIRARCTAVGGTAPKDVNVFFMWKERAEAF